MRLLLAALAVVLSLPATSMPAMAQAIKQVEVINFPDPQNVTGAVAVTNLPPVQDVNVANQPLAVTVGPPERFQLVGFTQATFDGDETLFGFTRACQIDFTESRICTSVEVMETTSIPNSLSGNAWVRPVLFGVIDNNIVFIDQSSVAFRFGELTCRQWTDMTFHPRGLTVDADGTFTAGLCDVARSVACCAPIP